MQGFVLPGLPKIPALALSLTGASAARGVRTNFERFEYKYWVSASMAERIELFMSPYMVRDSHAEGAKHLQRNTSLYFDSPHYDFFNMHVMRAPSRYKLRIRAYGDPPRGKAFFEVKQKVKTVTLKVRATAGIEDIDAVLAGRWFDSLAPKEHRNLETFLCLYKTHRVEPKIVIGSYREAFLSRRACEDVRMTFDKEIVYQRARGCSLAPDPKGWTAVPTAFGTQSLEGRNPVLIEMKFRGTAPEWMMEMVQRFNLRREAFSKYVSAVSHMCSLGTDANSLDARQLLKVRC